MDAAQRDIGEIPIGMRGEGGDQHEDDEADCDIAGGDAEHQRIPPKNSNGTAIQAIHGIRPRPGNPAP